MKKIIVVASIGLFSLTACKKDYTCECTTTSTSSLNGEPSPTSTDVSTVVLKDVSKKTVKNSSECMSYESTYTSTNGTGADLETWTSTDKTACTIK